MEFSTTKKPGFSTTKKIVPRAPQNAKKQFSTTNSAGVKGFSSKADAEAFGLKLGALDTMRGAIQLIPGKIGEANMARDQKRLKSTHLAER